MTIRRLNAAGELTEAGFQAEVIGLARINGWRIFHAPDNRPAGRTGRPQRLAAPEGKGFPDLVLVRPPRLIFAELKTDGGRVGPGQADWLDDLEHVGKAIAVALRTYGAPAGHREPSVEAYLWRPRNWQAIEATLAR